MSCASTSKGLERPKERAESSGVTGKNWQLPHLVNARALKCPHRMQIA
jgi:hypothetical protein